MHHTWPLYLLTIIISTLFSPAHSQSQFQIPHDPNNCFLAGSMRGQPSEDIAYAFQNVTCPLNTGYTALSTTMNVASVRDSCDDILIALRGSSEYLQGTAQMTSTTGEVYWQGGNILGIEFGVRQWVGQLVKYRQQIFDQGFGGSIPDQMAQQREAMKTFVGVVVSKIYGGLQQEAEGELTPVYAYFDCASRAFEKVDATVTACPSVTGAVSGVASSTGGGGTATSSGAASATSSTGAGSRIGSVSTLMVLGIVGAMIAVGHIAV